MSHRRQLMEVCPIADLNPGERRWVIKCRVTRKIPINNHPKDRGKGQIIYVDLKDASGEIRGVAFHSLVDKVDRLLEVDKEYFISGRMECLMPANKGFNPLDHKYEIYFRYNTCIKESAVGGDNQPTVQGSFVRLSEVPLYKDGTYIDVAGIAERTGSLQYFPHPERNAPFREVTLIDKSAEWVTVKLWNKVAEKFDGLNNPVLVLKDVKVKFSGVNGTEYLSTDSSTFVHINPELEVTENLNRWYYSENSSTTSQGSSSISSTSPAKVKDKITNLDNQDSSQRAGHSNEHSMSLEDTEAEKTYRIMLDAFKQGGAVEVHIGKCVTMGPPEAGKTQLKRALLGDFTIAEESTPACTKATPAVEIMLASESKWKHFEFEHLKTLSLQEDSVNKSPRDATNTAIIPSSDSVSIVAAVNDQPSTQNTSGNATSRSNSSESSLTIERQSSLESFQSLNEHVTKCLVESNCCDENLKSMKLIYMVDSGGQPSFLDFHPVTATFAASYLLVYNMEEGLDAKPKMTYRKSNNFPTKELPPSTKTNLEILHRSMLTVHHFQVRFDERHRKISELMKDKFRAAPSAPPLFIVGTRKVPSSTNSHRKKLKPLYQNIPSLKRATSCKFVESMSPNCEGTKELRDSVSNEDSLCSFRLPLSWLKLHLMSVVTESDPEEESSHKELQVQTYSDLCEMCLNENIVRSKDEFKAMIMVFHSLGVFSCPDLEFKETQNQIEDYLIFVNPNLLYGFVSKLLEIPFINLDKWRNRPSLKDLQLAGELTLTALEDLGIPDKIGRCDGIHRRLLSWLIRWGLAATMDAGEKLFVPSVLPLQPDLPLPFRTTPFDPFPLQFCFIYDSTKNYTFHYLPEGFFPHFVVTLMKEGYTLPENDPEPEDDGIVPRCRDAIFLIRQRQKFDGAKNTFNIQLVDEGTHISIHMCPAGLHTESTRREAGHVLAEIKRKIEHTNEKLYYRSHDEIALCCNCTCGSEQRFAECHLARIDVGNDDHIKMTCLHPKRSCQLAWENDVTDDLLRAVIQTFHQSSGQCADTPAAKIANTNKSIVNSAPEMDTSGPQSSSKHGQRTPDSPVEPAKRPGRRSSSRPCGDCDVAPTCTQMEQATFSTQQSNGEFKHLPGQSSEPAFSQDSSLGSRGKRSPNQDADRLTQKRTRFTNVSVDDVIQIMTREKLTRGVEKMLTKHRIQTLCDDVHLIDDECRNRILAMLNNGQKTDAADRLIDYFKNNHNGSSLVSFCDFLRSEAEGAGNAPNLLDFSKQIAEAMKKALQHHQ